MRRALVTLCAIAGGGLTVAGMALIYPPAAFLLAGGELIALTFVINVEE